MNHDPIERDGQRGEEKNRKEEEEDFGHMSKFQPYSRILAVRPDGGEGFAPSPTSSISAIWPKLARAA